MGYTSYAIHDRILKVVYYMKRSRMLSLNLKIWKKQFYQLTKLSDGPISKFLTVPIEFRLYTAMKINDTIPDTISDYTRI